MAEATPPANVPSSRADLSGARLSWRDIVMRSRRGLGAGLALLLILAVGVAGYQATWRQGLAEVRSNTGHRLDLFASAV